ncbi:MAG: TVP38/TMEM64 family protein [bacterium]
MAIVIGVAVAAVFWFDLYSYLTLEYFQAQQDNVEAFVAANKPLSVLLFFLVYILATGLSLPVAAVMALSAGALFGLVMGTVVISISSVAGATIAFLISRFLLQDYVDRRFPKATNTINEGIKQDGAYYLFCVRLVPAMPYFVLNLVMGLTHMPVRTFAWVTQLGLLPITLVLTNAGQEIARIESTSDIMSPTLIASLTLIGVFPLVAKKMLDQLQAKRSA